MSMLISGSSVYGLFSGVYPNQEQLNYIADNALSNGLDLFVKKDYEGAIGEFRRAIGIKPSSDTAVNASNYMAAVYLQKGETENAVNTYKTIIGMNPSNDDLRIRLANIYFSEQRYKEAETEYEEAVRINPSANNVYSLGQLYLQTDRYGEAEDQFNRYLRLAPDAGYGNYGLGLVYHKQGLHDQALEQFEEAVRLKEDFIGAYAEIGRVLADMGYMDDAEVIYEFLEQEDPVLADTLNRYMYKVSKPRIEFAMSAGTFNWHGAMKTPVAELDSYLETPNATKAFKMVFQFGKDMDRESVENAFNWTISRASGGGMNSYYYGLDIPDTEINIATYPERVYYSSTTYQATVVFNVTQNSTGDGTLDPSHLVFKFNGQDAGGIAMDKTADEFSGFSGIA